MATNLAKTTAGDLATFKQVLDQRIGAIRSVAASHLDARRITRIVLACVTKTPALRSCSIESVLRSTMQGAELGLEPGSATGEAYLVPYGNQCTLIVGYRGLISLAYRSGQVVSVRANVVYQGDTFDYQEGLHPVLRHIPNFEGERDASMITFAYCVIHLKEGGVLHDVMTRSEIDAIRARSRAGKQGPWVTDYAEMARKTVARRCLKYAPMSVEMSKAMALDEVDAGANDGAIPEFEFIDAEEEAPATNNRTEEVKAKLGVPPTSEIAEQNSGEGDRSPQGGLLP